MVFILYTHREGRRSAQCRENDHTSALRFLFVDGVGVLMVRCGVLLMSQANLVLVMRLVWVAVTSLYICAFIHVAKRITWACTAGLRGTLDLV